MLQSASVSQTGPFYPLEAEKKGIPNIYFGFIIATYAIVYIFSSIFTGRILSRVGRSRGLRYGLGMLICQLILLGSLYFVNNSNVFIAMSFLAQILGGIGAGANSTCSIAVISSFFPEQKELYIGILEAGVGLGMLFGPLFGALLYSIGGYLMPFWTLAAIFIAMYPFLLSTLKSVEVRDFGLDISLPITEVSESQEQSPPRAVRHHFQDLAAEDNEVTLKKLLSIPMFVLGLIAQVFVYGSIAFLTPTLSLHLLSYDNIDEKWVGIYFGVPAVLYILNTPLIYFYCKIWSRRSVVFFGSVGFCLSIFLIATSPLLHLPNIPKLIFVGLCLMGFSGAMITTPVFPEMVHSVENRYPELKGDELDNQASGYFNSCIGVGEAIGPITASVLSNLIGFRSAEDFIAIQIFIYCICFFFICGKLTLFRFKQTNNDDDFVSAEIINQSRSSGKSTPTRNRRMSGEVIGELLSEQLLVGKIQSIGQSSSRLKQQDGIRSRLMSTSSTSSKRST